MVPTSSVIVAHAPVGSGHRIAAESIAAEITASAPGSTTVEIVDALALGSVHPSPERLTHAFTGPTAGAYDAVWHSAGLGATARVVATPALAWAFRRFTQHLLDTRPEVVVCTHALPALLAARAVRLGRLSSKVVCVATDFGVHAFWPRTGVALFCVADRASADALAARGYAESQVAVTGIPIRPQFTMDYDRAAARAHFGLPPEKRVLLAMAGSTVSGPYVHFKSALATSLPALASLAGTTVVIITGQDSTFAEELRSRAAGFGVNNVHILGYIDKMAPLMAASNLGIAKPGGLVSAESIAMGLPLVLIGPAVGQERANADALAHAGIASFAQDPRTLAEHVRSALTTRGRLERMGAAAAELARPFAAADVAERVLRLTGAAVPPRAS